MSRMKLANNLRFVLLNPSFHEIRHGEPIHLFSPPASNPLPSLPIAARCFASDSRNSSLLVYSPGGFDRMCLTVFPLFGYSPHKALSPAL